MKYKAILTQALILIFVPVIPIVFAFAHPVPDTGQTECYQHATEIPCPEQGEPYYGQDAHYSINPQSYTKLDASGNDLPDEAAEWVMVRDNVTGLIWEIKDSKDDIPDYNNPHDADNTYTWSDSMGDGTGTEDFINALNSEQFGGYSDWRMPTIYELTNIVDHSKSSPLPSINTAYFPNTTLAGWWSSNLLSSDSRNALYVYFARGRVLNSNKENKAFVRAVRNGRCESFGTLVDNGDGTITDTATGLMWQGDASPNGFSWHGAIIHCADLSFAGYSDWRLPNRNEMQSIADRNRNDPSIDSFFSFPERLYWSSTTFDLIPSFAWYGNFIHGAWSSYQKVNPYLAYVRAVRGGQCESFDDLDDDCRIDCLDNCPAIPNGLNFGTCIKGNIALSCTSDEECGSGGFCSLHQEDTDGDYLGDACDNCPNLYTLDQTDTYPPQGNGIGDACDCESDFDCDGDVDGTDATTFKLYFGRNPMLYPCDEVNPCRGDFDCDQDCDGTDASLFKSDFGRSEFSNPCPACELIDWCGY